ncbi:MAG: orotate phosphoribosyltransferase [Eubacteriaceae bacterium]|nr:orotate phosphoribosyltransferase [Eubacteriaceae bacterium]
MKNLIARDLLKIKAVFFRPNEPFIWASGIKSPVYCDNRLTLSYPQVREDVEECLCTVIKENFPEAEILMGTATAGIPHAAICAHKLGLPMGYVRGSVKDHGRQNRIEGELKAGNKVVVIEDLISTGSSVIDAASALREAGAEVLGVASIFTYGMKKGLDKLKEANLVNISLTDFDTVASQAVKLNYIKEADYSRLISFRDNPSDESWIN